VKVATQESVTAEAGIFNAFKLVKEDRRYAYRWVTTYYFSPQTRSVVKMLFDTTVDLRKGMGATREIELIKYGVSEADAPNFRHKNQKLKKVLAQKSQTDHLLSTSGSR
jgi:hypothetical protein